MAISLFIAGDVVPKGITSEVFVRKGKQIFEEIRPFVEDSDFSIVNFEAPIIEDRTTPIRKSGPCLGVAPSTIEVLKNAGFGIFTLANNHLFDQGQEGVENTINKARECGILVVGGGQKCIRSEKAIDVGTKRKAYRHHQCMRA